MADNQNTTPERYVHGYDSREEGRLRDQADVLVELLHGDTSYPPGARVLEAGCGVGAQTMTLVARSPEARITSIDVSAESLAAAERRVRAAGCQNVTFRQADILALPFHDDAFDHVFVCFVLEHLRHPDKALASLLRVLRPGGTLTVIEGDHGSAYYHPQSLAAQAAIDALVQLQLTWGGDANIGRRLYPLLVGAGVDTVAISPRMVYVDASRPELVDGFTRKTFNAMVAGSRGPAIEAGIVDPKTFDAGLRDLERTTEADGTFFYTFFKAIGRKAT